MERSKDRSKAEFNAESNGATYVAIRALDRELRRSEDNRKYNLMFYPFKLEIRATLGNSRINKVYQDPNPANYGQLRIDHLVDRE